MKRLKIRIFPFSKSLSHPADRRRLVSWARSRGHELVFDDETNIDLIFISEGCDFLSASTLKGAPKVFDLVDGYLEPRNQVYDFLRGGVKVFLRQHKTYPRTYSDIVSEACQNVDMVICSSQEQMFSINAYNKNVRVILDNHSEFPLLKFSDHIDTRNSTLFWEGTTFTLSGLEHMLKMANIEVGQVNIVTDKSHPRVLGKYFKQDVDLRLRRKLKKYNYQFLAWSIENVVSGAKESTLSVLPVNTRDKLQFMKPENRLLIMFRLGLPSLTSRIPSYSRIERKLNTPLTCADLEEWEKHIQMFFNDIDLSEHQVIMGQKYLLENHTEEIIFDKWDDAIESLI